LGGVKRRITHFWVVFTLFGPLKVKLSQSTHTKRLKIVEQIYLGGLQHPTKFQVKILRGKKLWKILPIMNQPP